MHPTRTYTPAPTGQHVVGSVYAPIMYPPLPLLAFKLPEGAAAADGSGAQLAAVGALRGCDPDRVNLKRIMLTGEGWGWRGMGWDGGGVKGCYFL